jgi:DNA-binding transcriptional ArsR family regulator
MDGYEKEANLMKALSHPARLQILDLLAQGESCVCHLTTVLRQRQPYVSQQLMILREAGLVLDRRDGTIIYYRLADDRLAEIVALARELLPALGICAGFPVLSTEVVEGCPCPRCSDAAGITRAAYSDRVSQTPA